MILIGGPKITRICFVRPGAELPPGGRLLNDPARAEALRRWYASDRCRPEAREKWGPTEERTELAQIPLGAGDA